MTHVPDEWLSTTEPGLPADFRALNFSKNGDLGGAKLMPCLAAWPDGVCQPSLTGLDFAHFVRRQALQKPRTNGLLIATRYFRGVGGWWGCPRFDKGLVCTAFSSLKRDLVRQKRF